MPEPNDDGLVPPIKVLRKRLDGVYRADGFSGPTRRYVLIVAMLVGLASLPTLAAITAGSNQLNDGTTGAMDVPFLPPPSAGPVRPPSSAPADPPTTSPSADPADRVRGQAEPQRTKPRPSETNRQAVRKQTDDSRYGHSTKPPTPEGSPPVRPNRPAAPSRPAAPVVPPVEPVAPVEPVEPDQPGGGPPAGHDQCGVCGSRSAHHHRADRRCDAAAPRWGRSGHRKAGKRRVVVHVDRSGLRITIRPGRAGHPGGARGPGHAGDSGGAEHPDHAGRSGDFGRKRPGKPTRPDDTQSVADRSGDRSEPSRRSAVAERPHNVRPAGGAERTHNSRRHRTESPAGDTEPGFRAYRGSHRAEDSAAHRRSSRVGRHHADKSPHA